MIIQNSQIAMSGRHQGHRVEEENESLRYWSNKANKSETEKAVSALQFKSDKISISSQQNQTSLIAADSTVAANQTANKTKEIENDNLEEDIKHGWKITLLRRLFTQLTGKELKVVKTADFTVDDMKELPSIEPPPAQPTDSPSEMEGWGVEYHYQKSSYESEQTSFSAQGVVNTADGREIAINIELRMSREFANHESIDIRAGDELKDPLVINYAGTAAQLEETDLRFDIDLDGNLDQLKFVSAGSGFLALDKNRDGRINDGSELFGPDSGDGFTELADYDSDNNNWIDENDAIYERLRIWERNSQGETTLVSLGQRGIGAIYLERVETPFSLNGPQNNHLGEVRTTGLFLSESGLPGTVQQLEMVV